MKKHSLKALFLTGLLVTSTVVTMLPTVVRAADAFHDPYPSLPMWENKTDCHSIILSATEDESTNTPAQTHYFYEEGWDAGLHLPIGYTGTVVANITSDYDGVEFADTIWSFSPNSNSFDTQWYKVVRGVENTTGSTIVTLPITDYDGGDWCFFAWMKYAETQKTCVGFNIWSPGASLDNPVVSPILPSIVDDVVDTYTDQHQPPTTVPDSDSPNDTEGGKETVPMYRLYNPNSGEHFYSSDANEASNLVAAGWTHEGDAWKAPSTSQTPVYRLWNRNSGEHHYTTKTVEKESLIAVGWIDEGIGWYSDDNQTTPLYRLYNPNAKGRYEAGAHHYTASEAERKELINAGWTDEGIGWYGM